MNVTEILKKWSEDYSCDPLKREAFIEGVMRILKMNPGDIESLRCQILIKGEQ